MKTVSVHLSELVIWKTTIFLKSQSQKPLSFLKKILETTTKGFVSLRLKGKVAFAMSEVECGVSDPHF